MEIKSKDGLTGIKINKIAKLIMTDPRIDWAGVYISLEGSLKLGVYHTSLLSITELTELVSRLGGPALKDLIAMPSFGAKRVFPRVQNWW